MIHIDIKNFFNMFKIEDKFPFIEELIKTKKLPEQTGSFACGPYWVRTSDPLLVRQVL